MKKLLSLVISLVLCATVVCSATACSEVEDGSKIQRMNMVLTYTDEDGVSFERTVQIKLYLNYAPETCAQFIKLAESGYYDGLCVSDVESSWFEFGGYKYENDDLVKADGNVATVKGEFASNGFTGNPLKTTSAGVLVLKHDKVLDSDKDVSKYDGGKATVMVTFSSGSAFSSRYSSTDYCVFGKICSDDESYEETSDSTTYQRTSLDACKALASFMESAAGVTTYYYEPTGEYYIKYVYTDDDQALQTEYYEGAAVDEDKLLEGDELDDFKKLLSDENYNFIVVPAVRITVKSIKKA